MLSRRCVALLKTALRPDMWPKSELKLQWFDKLLTSVVGARSVPPSLGVPLPRLVVASSPVSSGCW